MVGRDAGAHPGGLQPLEVVEKGAALAAPLTDRIAAGAILALDQPVMRSAFTSHVSIRSEALC